MLTSPWHLLPTSSWSQGAMTAAYSSKIMGSVQLANACRLPIIVLVDVGGLHRDTGRIQRLDPFPKRHLAADEPKLMAPRTRVIPMRWICVFDTNARSHDACCHDPLNDAPLGSAIVFRHAFRGELSMLKANLEQFRAIRARTLDMVQERSQERMDYAPAPAMWSIGEVVDHLILSENITRREIAELIELSKAGRQPLFYRSSTDFNIAAFFLPKFMLPFLEVPFNFLNMFVPDSVRELFVRYRLIPARAADAATPRKGKSAAELHHGLRSSLEETEALFAANPNLDYDKMIHQHPFLGTQNVPRLLYILGLHEQRHQDQISDLLTNPQFPNAGRDDKGPHLSSLAVGPGHVTGEGA